MQGLLCRELVVSLSSYRFQVVGYKTIPEVTSTVHNADCLILGERAVSAGDTVLHLTRAMQVSSILKPYIDLLKKKLELFFKPME